MTALFLVIDTPPSAVLAFNWPVTTERKIVLELSKVKNKTACVLTVSKTVSGRRCYKKTLKGSK